MTLTEKILRAADKRRIIRSDQTNAIRLFDGVGDGFSALLIDDFAGRWIVQTRNHSEPMIDPVLGYRSLYWKPLLKTSKTGPQYLGGEQITEPFFVLESGLKFEVDFRVGHAPGLFLDQRINRIQLRSCVKGRTLLNTFAYTCAFGVAAAAGGASTVNLDLSRQSLDWGRRNYEINRINAGDHDFIYGDVFDWLKRFQRRGRKFDIIILDPPTFSRNRKSKVFRIREDYGDLAALAAQSLNPDGLLFCSTNFRAISFDEFLRILKSAIDRRCKAMAGSMPPDFTGERYLKTVWLQL
ncbi:MAG: class I SAM-dependent rRNA methyltransferase [Verrucomicrobia bacterium]|nr:class I SAM-dependent rRNA methyltransferase [Verrucomicrobiota bacterium]MBV8376766.1 class I SAM-dependent rRNA methyltransferase [Verrucomicrobiota bacterium]